MRGRTRIRTLQGAAAVLMAAALVGCGEDGGEQIPPTDAEAMLSTTAEIEAAFDADDCEAAESATTDLRRQVDELPAGTDPEIVDALNEMVSRLDDRLSEECAQTGTTDTTTETEPTAPTTTTPTTTTEEDDTEEGRGPPEQPPGEGGGPGGPRPDGDGDEGSGGTDAPTGGTEGKGREGRKAKLKVKRPSSRGRKRGHR